MIGGQPVDETLLYTSNRNGPRWKRQIAPRRKLARENNGRKEGGYDRNPRPTKISQFCHFILAESRIRCIKIRSKTRSTKFRPFCATEAENLFIETKGISIKCQPINQLPLDRHIQRGDKIFYRSISVTSVKIATRIPFGFTTTRYFPSFLSSPPHPFGKTFLVVVVVVVVEARIQSRI